ncbi:MAG: PadR family transcriptional regulator [Gemmatimonadetes bacterium]|nr:PadR family transcriptional regulator [Gemmatimonadota bacterium]NNM07127.1 PadR family transcriptional regulator [Gemmatimonadota bacterium]
MGEKKEGWSDDGFGFGFGAWGNPRNRRFRWRIFERGDLKFVILRLVSEKPMHGYEVMQALEEESCGCYKASPGSVYPTLQMLEDEGYVKSHEKDGKKTYEITDEGRTYLDENGDVVDEIFERIGDFADRFWGKDTRDLSAAFSRLAQSTFEGAFAWETGPEILRKMADALDRTRREMEDIKKKPGEDPPADEDPADEDSQAE